jgi:hypothetical protein
MTPASAFNVLFRYPLPVKAKGIGYNILENPLGKPLFLPDRR